MTTLVVVILSIIEGITEFLPISSTGHLILASHYMGIGGDSFVQNFNIVIQFGAILSVLVMYRERFMKFSKPLFLNIIVAFIPTAVIGFLAKDLFESLLDRVDVVAITLILGGFVLIWSDRWKFPKLAIEDLTLKKSFLIGIMQCFALVPGVSRAGATIVGAMALGLRAKEAAEFSFFLAVPTLGAASMYKLLKAIKMGQMQSDNLWAMTMGFILSFIFAMIAIRFFIGLLNKYGMKHFGYYRIALGALILLLL